jgi:hypothetical protein
MAPSPQVVILLSFFIAACGREPISISQAPQWEEVEIELISSKSYDNPYTDVEVHAVFKASEGMEIRRPAFWDGGEVWKVRFASPLDSGEWTWTTSCSDEENGGLHAVEGKLRATPYQGDNPLLRHGLLTMSPKRRNVIHHNGKPFLVVGDTPWAMPWRARLEDVAIYALDRQAKGFNAALMMTVLPDRDAEGPRARNTDGGFMLGFEDLPEGQINRPNIEYFQYYDSIARLLVEHSIVPVYQPVFHGYGWKGQNILGWNMDAHEYARYCRYLVARFGARPAMWLVGGDSNGLNAGVKEGGQMIEAWDAYRQPTGIHYNPFDDYCPDWDPEERTCKHENRSYHDAAWLDFQWCQTGHNGEHLFHKVARMYEYQPTKAVANGEPTYEGIREPANAAGWWQGHEAWMQVMSGGTMGHVYGAGGLWQWKISPAEPGWPEWANSNVSWRQAIELEGSVYVGLLSKAFAGFDFADMEKRPDLAGGQGLLAKPGVFYASYLPQGGAISISDVPAGIPYRWFDPKTGTTTEEGAVSEGEQVTLSAPGNAPWVLLMGEKN